MKKKVLIVSIGYPTKENPYTGAFIKEQVEFISSEYNCSVIVIREILKGIFFNAPNSISIEEHTKGIVQYYPVIYVSFFRRLIEWITSLIVKHNNTELAVGIFRSQYYRKYRIKRVSSIIKSQNLEYDLVYCISAQGAAYYAHIFSDIRHKPFVISEHRPYPHPGWATIDVEKDALNKADCFLAIGNDKIRQIMLQDIHPKRIAYVGNLIDESKFKCNPYKHEVKTILIIGAYSYFKNYDMFIATMEKLEKIAKNDFNIIVAGYGANKGYAQNTELLENKIRTSSVAYKIELISEIKRDHICELYNKCDAFVLTSIQEGQPIVCLEAAACGLPIFSTRCGGVEDYVTDKIGRIVNITDSDMLAEYLRQLIDDEITFNLDYIRNYIINLFGTDSYMKRMKSEFDRLLV